MSTTSKLAEDVARGVYAHDAEFFQRDLDTAIADAIHTAVSGVRVMFSTSASQLAAPDDAFCPKCGGTKPTCCSCPDPARDAARERATRLVDKWRADRRLLDQRFITTQDTRILVDWITEALLSPDTTWIREFIAKSEVQ